MKMLTDAACSVKLRRSYHSAIRIEKGRVIAPPDQGQAIVKECEDESRRERDCYMDLKPLGDGDLVSSVLRNTKGGFQFTYLGQVGLRRLGQKRA
jgi:hypothetical protein